MQVRDLPLLVAFLGIIGAMFLCGGDPDDTAQAIKGAALLLTSGLVWTGWYIGRRLMLGVAGLSELVRLLEEMKKDTKSE